jgi:peptidase S49-like protein
VDGNREPIDHEGRARAEVLSRPRPFRAEARPGECLAIKPEAFFDLFSFWGPQPNTFTEDGLTIIHIDGPLEHHASWMWDSYESIICRLEEALSGADKVRANEWEHFNPWREEGKQWDEGFGPLEATPPRAVVLCIDSPGGEAAGSIWCHRRIRALRKKFGVPIYAYANECAASAAYAIASACDEIWLPDTGLVGSIGVIATLYSRLEMNRKMGLQIELVTSGEEKADGHADRPITDPIRDRMLDRVMHLAKIFWAAVAKARGTSPKAVQSLQAGVFYGVDAVDAGLADGVAGWNRFLRLIAETVSQNDNNVTTPDTASAA